jgi:hypothetical protein
LWSLILLSTSIISESTTISIFETITGSNSAPRIVNYLYVLFIDHQELQHHFGIILITPLNKDYILLKKLLLLVILMLIYLLKHRVNEILTLSDLTNVTNIFPSNGSLFTQIIDDTETMSSKYDNLFRTLRAFKWKTENLYSWDPGFWWYKGNALFTEFYEGNALFTEFYEGNALFTEFYGGNALFTEFYEGNALFTEFYSCVCTNLSLSLFDKYIKHYLHKIL